jgi:ABC-2 type transporter
MPTAIHPARETLRQLTAIRRRCQMSAKLGAGRAVASGPALEVRGLQKRYGERVGVRDVSFSVARGEIFGILGPNGLQAHRPLLLRAQSLQLLPGRYIGVVIGAFVLATLAFQALGFLIGSVMRTARGAQAMGMLLFFPMWLLSGAAPPPSLMCAGMRQVSALMPLTFAVRAIQQPWLGAHPKPLDLLLLGGLLIAAAAMSARVLLQLMTRKEAQAMTSYKHRRRSCPIGSRASERTRRVPWPKGASWRT